MRAADRTTDAEYHLRRARAERDMAYRSPDLIAGDAHMRLSALHLGRALLLQQVRREPVENVHPFPPVLDFREDSACPEQGHKLRVQRRWQSRPQELKAVVAKGQDRQTPA